MLERGISDVRYFYELKQFIETPVYGFTNINVTDTDNPYNRIIKDPKIEYKYFCYRYLRYIRTFKIHDIPLNSDKETVLIESREYPHLEFVIRNTILKLPQDWSHTVVCTKNNREYMTKMCANISKNIKIVTLDCENITVNQYSSLLASKLFWNNFVGEKILIYQDDTCIFKSNIDDFLQYDYIGAPWLKSQNDNYYLVGNGGLSLRSKSATLKVIDTVSIFDTKYNSSTLAYIKLHSLSTPMEDVYFSKNTIDYNLGIVANYDTALLFSCESVRKKKKINNCDPDHDDDDDDYIVPVGGHCWWHGKKNWKKMLYDIVVVQMAPQIHHTDILNIIEHR